METSILYQTSHPALRVVLAPGEAIVVESSAITSMTLNAQAEPRALAGERPAHARLPGPGGMRLVQVTAPDAPVELLLCPSMPGEIVPLRVSGDGPRVVSSALLAASAQVDITANWAGAHELFAWENPVLLATANVGDVFVAAAGACHIVELQQGQAYRIHTAHLVAFDATVQHALAPAAQQPPETPLAEGKWCDFVGPGRVYMQTRSVDGLLGRLAPRLLNAP